MKRTADTVTETFTLFGREDSLSLRELAARLRIPFAVGIPERRSSGLWLQEDGTGLSLVADGQSMKGDFSALLPRVRRIGSEMLCKAVRIRNRETVTVLDATAGMGEDSFLLAAMGCRVSLYERDPVIAALLRDALCRAAADPAVAPIVSRMTLREEDSISAMRELTVSPDVILLDPMFPERQKSGLVKKKFQLLHRLEEPCDAEEALLAAAIDAKPLKIVIKRPAKGPFLAGRKPSYSLSGKAVRYDCLLFPENSCKTAEN